MKKTILLLVILLTMNQLSAQHENISLIDIEVNYMASQADLTSSEYTVLYKLYSECYEKALAKAELEKSILNTDIDHLTEKQKAKLLEKWQMTCTLAADAEIKYDRLIRRSFSKTKQLKLIRAQSEIHTKILNEWHKRNTTDNEK